LKIAIISSASISVPPKTYGGGEFFVYNLCEGLIKLGQDITLFATGDSITSAKLEYIFPSTSTIPQNFLDESKHIFFSVQKIKEDNTFDIVQVNHPIALIYSNYLKIPMIYTMHFPKSIYLQKFISEYQNVNYVAISKNQAENLEYPIKNLSIINHGIDSDFYEPSYNMGQYLAYLGRFSKIKGVHYAIESAQLAREKIKVAGSCVFADDYAYYEEKLKFSLAYSNVEHIGEVSGKEKIKFLQNAKALLVPSIIDETFCLVIIEALMCGTPVIAFDKGPFRELIEDGKTGFLVKEGDTKSLALAIKKICLINRKDCRNSAFEKFNYLKMTKSYLELFTKLKNIT